MATKTKKNTLNDLKEFAASTVPAGAQERVIRDSAQRTLIKVIDGLSGAILKADGEPVPSGDAVSMEAGIGDMFWALAALAVAYDLDLDEIVHDALPEYQRRHEQVELLRQDPIEYLLRSLGIN